MTVRDEGTVDGLPGKVRPAHQVEKGPSACTLTPDIDELARALQGENAGWLLGLSRERERTATVLRSALMQAAVAAYHDWNADTDLYLRPWRLADGSCACPLGARCATPGQHALYDTEHGGPICVRWSDDVALLALRVASADLALEMGPASGVVAVVAEPTGIVPLYLPPTLTFASQSRARIFLYARPAVDRTFSGPLAKGVRLLGDGVLVPVPPGAPHSGVPFGWETPSGSPTDVTPIPSRALLSASRSGLRNRLYGRPLFEVLR